jgi:[histone H3]-lysine36 N-dimethyltransferase SETMAR
MAAAFVPTVLHIRNALLFLYFSNNTMRDTERQLASVYPGHVPHYNTIRAWYHRFESGDYSLEDAERSGRPVELDLTRLEQLVEGDPFQSVRDMAQTLGVHHRTIETGLRTLGKVKKLGRFVPHRLSQFDLDRRVDMCTTLLTLHRRMTWLDQIVTGDEKWVMYSNHHRKRQWVDAAEEPDEVPKPDLHPKKVMLSVWWSVYGVVYWELLPVGSTITGDIYARQLQKLKAAVDRMPALRSQVYFLHDNARPHIARPVKFKLARFNWTVLPHPPYSPDLAPSDYWLFGDMQRYLEGRDFNNDNWVKVALMEYFKSRAAEFWRDGIHKLPQRWQHVIDTDGAYN